MDGRENNFNKYTIKNYFINNYYYSLQDNNNNFFLFLFLQKKTILPLIRTAVSLDLIRITATLYRMTETIFKGYQAFEEKTGQSGKTVVNKRN